jgi:hypothetical protein
MRQIKSSGTCLAVLREKAPKNKLGKLVFAGDRRISWGSTLYQVSPRPKITKRNGVMFAGTGVSYLCDIVCELVDVPEVPYGVDGFNYVHNHLFPRIKDKLGDKGFVDKDGNISFPDDDFAAMIIVGVNSELFEVSLSNDSGITLDAIEAPYAHGCGGRYAMGSLDATDGDSLKVLKNKLKQKGVKQTFSTPEECRLVLALIAASRYSSGCDANIDILHERDIH